MANPAVDRNVLFGVLAWQLGVVDREPLMTAMYSCRLDPAKSLPEMLVAAGLISPEDRLVVERAVERQLQKHDNDAARTLADIGSVDDVCRQLRSAPSGGAAPTIDSVEAVDRHAQTIAPQHTMQEGATEFELGAKKAAFEVERFRVVRPHARGGLGEVFVAVDEELNREVAVKQILARHADNQVSRTRFMLEAEVTGNLEHPGVVPVYGLGAQADGRPYYAMRFIRGQSLEDAIVQFYKADDDPLRDPGKRALELRDLLSRFVAVCNTIEYAHSRGYVHRDIKPENIMLGPYGETLVVDWGLARPMELTDPALATLDDVYLESDPPPIGTPSADRPTQMGSVVGTPQFMSPEQASGQLDKIRAPSDVYSLGATLYYLLTDQPAFIASDVRKVLRDVREGKFPPPRQVKRDAPRGLEAICLKAMAHDPADRYASARALANDVEHWLADEPVSAMPETSVERMQRWLRRHKTWARAAAAALVVVAVVAGIAYAREAGLRAQVQTALSQEAQARREADEARALADRNAQLAQEQRANAEKHALRAEQQSALALDTLNRVLFDIQVKLKNVPAAHTVRLSMLNSVIDGLKRVARNLETSTEADHALVRAYIDLGDVFMGVGASEGTSATDEAAAMFDRAVKLATTLYETDQRGVTSRGDLAAAYQRMGDIARQRGNQADAAQWYRKSLPLRERLVEELRDDLALRRELGDSVQRLGLVNEELRDLNASQTHYERFVALTKGLTESDPQNLADRRTLSVAYERMGDLSLLKSDKEAARKFFEQCLEVRRSLVAANENNGPARRDLSVTLDRLGKLVFDGGDAAAAEEYYRESLKLREGLYEADPENVQSSRDVLVSYALLGDLTLGRGDLEGALMYYQRYERIAAKLILGDPNNVQFLQDLANSYYRQGDVLLRSGNSSAALAYLRKYYELLKQMAESDPANAALRENLLTAGATAGDLSLHLGRYVEAAKYFAESTAEARRRFAERPDDPTATAQLVDALVRSADMHVRLLDLTAADTELREALQLAEAGARANKESPAALLNLAGAEGMLTQFALELRDADAAAKWIERATTHLQAVVAGSDASLRPFAKDLLNEQSQLPQRCETAKKAAADAEFAANQPVPDLLDLLDFAAVAQLKKQDFAAAEKTLERLAVSEPKSSGRLFAAARRYAAAAPADGNEEAEARRKKFLDRALQLLQEAETLDAFGDPLLAARLEHASDFRQLKDRKEFVELLEKVRRRGEAPAPKTT